jgi:hypothetical protein
MSQTPNKPDNSSSEAIGCVVGVAVLVLLNLWRVDPELGLPILIGALILLLFAGGSKDSDDSDDPK